MPWSFGIGESCTASKTRATEKLAGRLLRNARSAGESVRRANAIPADAFLWQREPICLVGHTHVPACFTTTATASRRPHVEDITTYAIASTDELVNRERAFEATETTQVLQIANASRMILNPGSVGQPRDRDPRASYAVIDLDRMAVEFNRVAYDIEEAMRRTRAAGLPEILSERLAVGA